MFCLMKKGSRELLSIYFWCLQTAGLYKRWKWDRKWNVQLFSQLGEISALKWIGKETARNGNSVMFDYKQWKGELVGNHGLFHKLVNNSCWIFFTFLQNSTPKFILLYKFHPLFVYRPEYYTNPLVQKIIEVKKNLLTSKKSGYYPNYLSTRARVIDDGLTKKWLLNFTKPIRWIKFIQNSDDIKTPRTNKKLSC